MSTSLNLGRIMPINKGSYAGSTSYAVLDVVEHNGSSYWCKAACQGVEPPNASYWVLMASKGADGTNGQDGTDGVDAYQPCKGWFGSSSALSTEIPSPNVGDYAYVLGSTASDPVAVYTCSVAGTWADSGSEFNPANNQSFQTGQDLDQTKIINDLTTGGANHVLSAEAGKTLKQGLDALGPKIGQLDAQINGAAPTPIVETYDYSSGYNIGQTYCTLKGTHQLVNGKTYTITIADTESDNTTLFRLYDSTNTNLVITEISGSQGTGARSFSFTANDNGYVAMTVKKLNVAHSYDISITENVAASGLAHDVEVLQEDVEDLQENMADAIADAEDAKDTAESVERIITGGTPQTSSETYDFEHDFAVGQNWATKKGTTILPAGKYRATLSSNKSDNSYFLRLYDATNTDLVITEIENSRSTEDRTVDFETEVSGILAVTIRTLNSLCTVDVVTNDISSPDGLMGDVTALKAAATRKDKKVLIIGDSISTGPSSAAMSSNMPSYGSYDKWVDMLMEDGFFPKSTQNCSQHATGFVAQDGSSSWISHSDFLNRLKYFVNNNTIDLSEIDLIVVFGGINDFKLPCPLGTSGDSDVSNFIPALEAFYSYLIENATQARICVLLPTRTSLVITNQLGLTIENYTDAIKQVLKVYSIPYLDLTEQSGFCPTNATFRAMWTLDWNGQGTGDGLHPNEAYQRKYLKKMIRGFLEPLI